jgi:hypothetical protein
MVGTVLPFLVIFGSNIMIILSVRQASRRRLTLGSITAGDKLEKETQYLTRMLMFVSFAYVIITLPYRMYHLVMKIPQIAKLYDMTKVYWRMRYVIQGWAISNVWIFNYAVNFYLYCVGGGQKYRKDAKDVMLCLWPCYHRGRKFASTRLTLSQPK